MRSPLREVVDQFRRGTGSSCEPDEARGRSRSEAYVVSPVRPAPRAAAAAAAGGGGGRGGGGGGGGPPRRGGCCGWGAPDDRKRGREKKFPPVLCAKEGL